MGEGFSSTQSSLNCAFSSDSQRRYHQTALGLTFPVYIVSSTFNSPHLNALQKKLQTNRITVSIQHSNRKVQLLKNTYQKVCFVVLQQEDKCNFQDQNATYQIVRYPQIDLQVVLQEYRKFVNEQVQKISYKDLQALRLSILGKQQIFKKEQETSQLYTTKSAIKLRNVSKILNNYKSISPKRLFIYSNRHDDTNYQKYISLIQNMSFDNASFILHIEDYLKYLPQKGDVSFCILMSEYTVLNLRKYFKGADQILLLCQNTEKCLPLLRGKVSFFTTQVQSLDKLLIEKYGMKNKQFESLQIGISEKRNQKLQIKYQSQKQSESSNPSISTLRFHIQHQYSLIKEPARKLELQSNILAHKYTKMDRTQLAIFQQHNQYLKSEKELPANCQRQQNSSIIKQMNEKWTPLKVVHLQMPSIANITFSSSQVTHQHHIFYQLFGQLRNQARLDLSNNGCNQMFGGQYKHQGVKQNCSNSAKGSTNSRFSKASHKSRIIDRIKKRQSRMSLKLKNTY